MSQRHSDTSDPSVVPSGSGEVVHRTRHDVTEDGLTVSIAMALEEAIGVPATETISNFSSYADPDALCRLFRTPAVTDGEPNGRVRLRIEGHDVLVYSDGEVEVRRRPTD